MQALSQIPGVRFGDSRFAGEYFAEREAERIVHEITIRSQRARDSVQQLQFVLYRGKKWQSMSWVEKRNCLEGIAWATLPPPLPLSPGGIANEHMERMEEMENMKGHIMHLDMERERELGVRIKRQREWEREREEIITWAATAGAAMLREAIRERDAIIHDTLKQRVRILRSRR